MRLNDGILLVRKERYKERIRIAKDVNWKNGKRGINSGIKTAR